MTIHPDNIFIISGPSGAGEDSIIAGLHQLLPIERVITTTTRTMRDGESQGDPYYFVSQDEFHRRALDGEFIEHAQEYNGQSYGVTQAEIDRVKDCGKIGIWKIEWKGVIKAKQLFPGIKAIFITVSDLSILERRIRRRNPGISEETLRERAEYTRQWMEHTDIYDYTVFNEEGKLEESIQQVRNIITSEMESRKNEESHPQHPEYRA